MAEETRKPDEAAQETREREDRQVDGVFVYTGIDGTKYEQRPPLLKQCRQVLGLVKKIEAVSKADVEGSIVDAVKNAVCGAALELHQFAAIVLWKEDWTTDDKHKAGPAFADELDENLLPEDAARAVDDFFTSPRVSSMMRVVTTGKLLGPRLAPVMELVNGILDASSKTLTSSLPGSPGEAPSNTDA